MSQSSLIDFEKAYRAEYRVRRVPAAFAVFEESRRQSER